jgi:cytochrome oxidase Cu insertion factor (SCO1/SenC/PrrC family)
MQDSRRRGRRILLTLAAIFLLPVAVAFTLYYGKLWRPAGSASQGELITPARPIDVTGLRSMDGRPVDATTLTGKWSLVYIGDGRCDAACRQALVFARQSRLALNNEMSRVQRVFLATANCCDTAYLSREHVGLETFDASAPEAQALLAQFPADRAHSLYIVDPLGNLMMRHDSGQTTKGLLSDLKKLLKLSHIG